VSGSNSAREENVFPSSPRKVSVFPLFCGVLKKQVKKMASKNIYTMSPSKHSKIFNSHGHVSCIQCGAHIEIGQDYLSSRRGGRKKRNGVNLYCMTCAEELYLI